MPAALQKTLTVIAVIAALVMLLVGGRRTHKVYADEADEFGLITFQRISEREIIEDATFSGVRREGKKLITTYDRSAPQAKRSCPT